MPLCRQEGETPMRGFERAETLRPRLSFDDELRRCRRIESNAWQGGDALTPSKDRPRHRPATVDQNEDRLETRPRTVLPTRQILDVGARIDKTTVRRGIVKKSRDSRMLVKLGPDEQLRPLQRQVREPSRCDAHLAIFLGVGQKHQMRASRQRVDRRADARGRWPAAPVTERARPGSRRSHALVG